MSAPMTTRTSQKSRLFRVEFMLLLCSGFYPTATQFQDYHACVRGRYTAVLCNCHASDPHNPTCRVSDDRQRIAFRARDAAVDQHILQLPSSGRTERAKPVAGTPIPHSQRKIQRRGLKGAANSGALGQCRPRHRRFEGCGDLSAGGKPHGPRHRQGALEWRRRPYSRANTPPKQHAP